MDITVPDIGRMKKVCGAGDLDLYDGGIFSRRGSMIFSKDYQKEQPQHDAEHEHDPNLLGDTTDLDDGMVFSGNRYTNLFVRFDPYLQDTTDLYDGGIFSKTGNAVFSASFNSHNPVDLLGDCTDLGDGGIFNHDEYSKHDDLARAVDLSDGGIFEVDPDSQSQQNDPATADWLTAMPGRIAEYLFPFEAPLESEFDCN